MSNKHKCLYSSKNDSKYFILDDNTNTLTNGYYKIKSIQMNLEVIG